LSHFSYHRWMAAASGYAILLWLMAIAGTVIAYSPVPYWDMWGGTLGFYLAMMDGNQGIWWSQHNEHRIVLSRLLFWLDFKLFSGLGAFLIVINLVLVMAAVATFNRMATHYLGAAQQNLTRLFTAMTSALLILWVQSENLTWAFQSQFFLAQLLPLLGLYLLARSALPAAAARRFFVLACITGVACIGSMANGVIALPLMTVLAATLGFSRRRLLILSGLSCITLLVYFYDYQPPAQHGSIMDALLTQPFDLAHYVLLYLGSPFFMLAGEGPVGLRVATAAGAIMAAATIALLPVKILKARDNVFALALLFYLVFIAGTAAGTGSGRLVYGIEQAVTARYTTPALMAWAALLLLYLPWISKPAARFQWLVSAPGIGLALWMLNHQITALTPQHQTVFDKSVAAMALELAINDERQINHIYVLDDGLRHVARMASERNIGHFGVYPWQDLRQRIGQVETIASLPDCAGYLDVVSAIPDEAGFVVIAGWLLGPSLHAAPGLIRILDATGKIAGFALTGMPRPDVQQAVADGALLSGYRGYVSAASVGEAVRLVSDTAQCQLLVEITNTGSTQL